MKDVRIGISGWRYAPWRGVFYPPDLTQKRELEFASRTFSTIEINGSFYSLQHPESYRNWCEQTPPHFVFSVKAPRYITHILRLRNIETPLANFFASGIFNLGAKLGPLLWQFPPNFRFDEALFGEFLAQLPHDTQAAIELASAHDSHIRGPAVLTIDRKRRLRHAVEIRHDSFIDERFVALLRKHRVALVVADTAGKWPYYEDLTADFVYVRLHGDAELYTSGYSDAALQNWAERIRAWSAGRQPADARLISSGEPRSRASRRVYCYFDNDAKVHAPFDASSLLKLLGIPASLPHNGSGRSGAGGKKKVR